jgi:hypothetical protein
MHNTSRGAYERAQQPDDAHLTMYYDDDDNDDDFHF